MSARREAMLERRAVVALGRSAATGCAGSPAAVAPALASAGLPALSASPASPAVPAGAASTGAGSSASLRTVPGARSPSPRGGRNLTVKPSGARTEQAETGASFPSALVTALLALLLLMAMVVVPRLRHRAVPVAGGLAGASAGLAQTRGERAPGGASGDDSVSRPQDKTAARPFRRQVAPMDSAIAPMAADAFSRMAYDADQATDPESEPPADHESKDRGDAE